MALFSKMSSNGTMSQTIICPRPDSLPILGERKSRRFARFLAFAHQYIMRPPSGGLPLERRFQYCSCVCGWWVSLLNNNDVYYWCLLIINKKKKRSLYYLLLPFVLVVRCIYLVFHYFRFPLERLTFSLLVLEHQS